MCGICGAVTFDAEEVIDQSLILAMLARLRHRGPDSAGYYRDGSAALASARLAIVDVNGGDQPISNETESLWVAYNGEIYNHVELGRELEGRGHVFATRSDTEVVVHAYEAWGADCFSRFNGQWAVALWDRSAERLILCRDRLGVRPLYWTMSEKRLLFASEIKALFADPAVSREIGVQGLAQVLSFWCPVAPVTPFEAVRQLRPGHYAVFDRHGLREAPYWTIPFSPEGILAPPSFDQALSRLRSGVEEAVKLRLFRSDVPVAAYVSGGVDSAIVAALAARYAGSSLHSFSLSFDEAEFDESGYQQRVVDRIGCTHSTLSVSPEDIGGALPQAIWHAEHPLLRAAPVPMFLLSERVQAAGFKVVLTGEGADEVLAGYDIFRETVARNFWSRDPDSRKRRAIVEMLYPWMPRSPAGPRAMAHVFFGRDLRAEDPGFSHRPRWQAARILQRLLSAQLRERMTSMHVDGDLLAQAPSDFMRWPVLHRAQWLEMKTLLDGYILSSQGDRMLMAHSVEGRFPFLDPAVVELACGLPPEFKLMGLSEKHVLKRAFADVLPRGIALRPKQPYRAPDAESLFPAKPLDWVDDLLSEERVRDAGILDPASVLALAAKCRSVHGRGMSNADNMGAVLAGSAMLLHHLFVRGEHAGRCSGADRELDVVVDRVAGTRRRRSVAAVAR